MDAFHSSSLSGGDAIAYGSSSGGSDISWMLVVGVVVIVLLLAVLGNQKREEVRDDKWRYGERGCRAKDRAALVAPVRTAAPASRDAARLASHSESHAARGPLPAMGLAPEDRYGSKSVSIWDSSGSIDEGHGVQSFGQSQRGAYTHMGDPNLFENDFSELPEKHANWEDWFPSDYAVGEAGAKDNKINAMYTFGNFRNAHEKDSAHGGYLRPIFTRNGISRFGARDPWMAAVVNDALRNDMSRSGSVDEHFDGMMVPVPDQFMDFSADLAAEHYIPLVEGNERLQGGMNMEAVGAIYEKEAEKRQSGTRHSLTPAEYDEIVQVLRTPIDTSSDAAAAASIQAIVAAAQKAKLYGAAVPEPHTQTLQVVANCKAGYCGGPHSQQAAAQVANVLGYPLPPSGMPTPPSGTCHPDSFPRCGSAPNALGYPLPPS